MKRGREMKKERMKRVAAKAMALALAGTSVFGMVGLAMPENDVYAATEGSIVGVTPKVGSLTINKKAGDEHTALEGAKFSVYRVMDLTPGKTAGQYAKFTVNDNFKDELSSVSPDALGNYSAEAIENLATSLAVKAADTTANIQPDGQGTTGAGTGTLALSDLPLGYYLVVETSAPEGYVAGKPFLVAIPSTNSDGTAWDYDVSTAPKNAMVSLEKDLAAKEEGAEQDGSVAVGDFVKYEIKTTIPSYTEEYFDSSNTIRPTFTITDIMSDGLEIQNDTEHPVTVKVNNVAVTKGDETYILTATPVTGENADMTIAFKEDYIKANGEKQVVVTYYAKVTDAAIMGNAGNANKATLTYNNKPGTVTQADTPEVKVYSFGIKVQKFAVLSGGKKALDGAKFELYSDAELNNKVGAEVTTGKDGTLSFDRVDEGIYYLKETKAPHGYTLLVNPIKIEIAAGESEGKASGAFTLKVDGKPVDATTGDFTTQISQSAGVSTIAVENHAGFSLPATGGMGIAIFLLIGAAGIITISVVMMKKTGKKA